MSNDKFYKYATIVALITAIATSYNYYEINNNSQPACDIDVNYISGTIQDWMKKEIPNNFFKTNNLKIVDMKGFAEYNTIPQWNRIPLYEDFKHSTVCSATAFVDLSPISTNKEKTDNADVVGDKNIEEISLRYQLIVGGGIRMSGPDVEDMNKQLKEAVSKRTKNK